MPRKLSADGRMQLLTAATEEARRRGDRRLGTDHLLLGLLHDANSPVAKALGVSLADARAAVQELDATALAGVGIESQPLHDKSPGLIGRGFPPLTSGARAALKRAIDDADPFRSGRLEATHFLLALLSLQLPDPAAELLDALGVDPAAVRRRLADQADGEVA